MTHPKNQLDRVICQIRFSGILSIDRDIALFQELICDEYPDYESALNMPMGIENIPVAKEHVFKNTEAGWSVSASIAMLSISTSRYVDWSDFSARFERVFEAFRKCFDIKDVTRIGLRYINAIRPTSLGGQSGEFADLIEQEYLRPMSFGIGRAYGCNTIIESRIDEYACRSSYGTIRFADTDEIGFMIDNDIYCANSTEVTAVIEKLQIFHDLSERAFRELTTEQLQRKVGL